jgi:hypothetical protein
MSILEIILSLPAVIGISVGCYQSVIGETDKAIFYVALATFDLVLVCYVAIKEK